jgi:NADH dehydrogenase
VEDLADAAIAEAHETENRIINAIGPEVFAFRDLVAEIGKRIGKRPRLVSIPPWLGWSVGWILGKCMGDVIITWPEIKGLMREQLYCDSDPLGKTKLTTWLEKEKDTVGVSYTRELSRRKDRITSYDEL